MYIEFPVSGSKFSQFFTSQYVGTEVLSDSEKVFVKTASEKRKAEFSTGRFCAKKAIEGLNLFNQEILMGDHREPLWPGTIAGSISHSKNLAGAVVAFKSEVVSIGLDIEKYAGVKKEMWDMLFTTTEIKFLDSLLIGDVSLFSTLLFSFKESFYKLQWPLTKIYLDFKDVEFDYSDGNFSISLINKAKFPSSIQLESIIFEWIMFEGDVVTLCYLKKFH